MDTNNEQRLCDLMADYSLDQLNDMDRLRYERHLDSCASCRQDVRELQEVWESMPYDIDMVDPPLDLKAQVMNTIFSEPQSEVQRFNIHEKPRRSLWFYSISVSVILSIIVGTIWNYQLTEERFQLVQSQLEQAGQPSTIDKLFSLTAQSDIASSNAYGIACIVKQGNNSELVVYVYNVQDNQGDEAYQVWLLNKSERTNAGTFQVGEDGVGVLTYRMNQEANFDAIGITLEPDSKGDTPRGQKMFGTTEQISWY